MSGLIGIQGPGINDFIQVGVTGVTNCFLASGAMVQFNTQQALSGNIGHTNIGTAAGWITVQKSAYYQVDTKINLTGLPSGVGVQAQQFIGATGGNGRFGFGSGTTIDQSLAYFQNFSNPTAVWGTFNTIHQSYVVYIPSGTSIETYVNYLTGGGGSGVCLSATGTYFTMRSIGT